MNREATSVRGYVALREQRCRQSNYPKSTLTAIWTFSRMQLLISERSTTVRSRKRGGLALRTVVSSLPLSEDVAVAHLDCRCDYLHGANIYRLHAFL